MKMSDSQWHRQLSEVAEHPSDPDDPYWLGPFQTSSSFCPYLVGGYRRVAEELARYIWSGVNLFILDIPPSREELQHTMTAFEQAVSIATSCRAREIPAIPHDPVVGRA
jgi:alkanesulfonate monooxygenase